FDIDQRFRRLNLKEHELMKNLQGSEAVFDKDGPGEGGFSGNDPFDFMVLERIEAWSGLMLHEQEQNETSGLFVTSNRSIFTYMIENSSAGEMVLDSENIPIGEDTIEEMHGWRDSLMKNVQKYAKDPWPVDINEIPNVPVKNKTGRKISLSLYVIPGENPLGFFARFYPHKVDFSYKRNERRKNINTLLGLFEIQP
ncbi:MAG: hypothetical protein MUP22_02420, partial [Desulfobacterales bacterium]|nr:hypothetical protein [Desulfobacterales bacterium]